MADRSLPSIRGTLLASCGLALLALAFAPELVVVLLLGLLIARELAAIAGPTLVPLARKLTIAVVPFLVLFALLAVDRLAALLLNR